MNITIQPTSKRAKERVRQHGEEFVLKRRDTFAGKPAILVDSVEATGFRVEGKPTIWTGWFTEDEAKWEKA